MATVTIIDRMKSCTVSPCTFTTLRCIDSAENLTNFC